MAGEVSYRPNMPLQLNSTDLTVAALYPTTLFGNPIYASGAATPSAGEVIHGYVRKPVTQAQVTVTQFFDQVLAAERLTVVGEVGYNHISGIDDSELRFGRDSIWGIGELPNNSLCQGLLNTANPGECNNKGFYTSSSWGYRVRGILDYPNVIAGINFKPNLAWSHDVHGYGPNFSEGAKAVSVGLDADYQNTYTASISYTDFFGGDYNPINDRDFIAVSWTIDRKFTSGRPPIWRDSSTKSIKSTTEPMMAVAPRTAVRVWTRTYRSMAERRRRIRRPSARAAAAARTRPSAGRGQAPGRSPRGGRRTAGR